jgi:hypothetical protein
VAGERFDLYHKELLGIHQLTDLWEQMYMGLRIQVQKPGLSSLTIQSMINSCSLPEITQSG